MFAVKTIRITCQLLKPTRGVLIATKHFRFSLVDYGTQLGKRSFNGRLTQMIQRRSIHGKDATTDSIWLIRFSKNVWSKMFGKYLFATNVIGSGVLMVVGDVIAQEYEYRRGIRRHDGFDYPRVWRMFVAGALQGPLHHWVYNWMDKVMPQRTFRTIVNKILIDQFFMSPVCIVIFFYTICALEHQTIECINKELMQKFPYIYLLDWLTWPAAQYVNFRYLDTKYRVAFVNVCTAVYNVFISYMKHDFGLPVPLEFTHDTVAVAPVTANTANEMKTKAQ